jgi:hypothetical protein
MSEPIEYQPLLPAGYQLRYDISADGIRISRESPGKKLLGAEAIAPLILLVSSFIFVVLLRRQVSSLNLSKESSIIVQTTGYFVILLWLIYNGRRAWQNIGIIVEITIFRETFYWRKQNLWGPKEYFWALSSIGNITVENRLLKVRRRRGPALAAFSFVKQEERTYACQLLNQAIAYQRRRFEDAENSKRDDSEVSDAGN